MDWRPAPAASPSATVSPARAGGNSDPAAAVFWRRRFIGAVCVAFAAMAVTFALVCYTVRARSSAVARSKGVQGALLE
jgi:hypothetical protein